MIDKRRRRAERERALAGRILVLPDKRYGVILADPEWKFETYSENGKDRSAENHYACSPTEVIRSRNVASIAADDSVLFLWATVPMVPDALDVMSSWGFKYKSQFVWVKYRIGTGYWGRNQHELLLVGTRGSPPAPAMGEQWSTVIHAPARRHSQKPEASFALIEDYFPTLPRIELNARTARPGWDCWGLEAPGPRRRVI